MHHETECGCGQHGQSGGPGMGHGGEWEHHGYRGQGGVGLNLRNPVVQEADPEFLALTARDGREGTPMAAFGKEGLGLRKQDIVDLIAYVKTLGTGGEKK